MIHNMSPTERQQVVTEGNEAVRRTLRALMRYRGMTAKALAEATGIPYNTVQQYTGGKGQLTGGYMEAFSKQLGVPRHVLAMDEDEALMWVLEHAPNGSLAVARERVITRYRALPGQQTLPLDQAPAGATITEIDLRDSVGGGAIVTWSASDDSGASHDSAPAAA